MLVVPGQRAESRWTSSILLPNIVYTYAQVCTHMHTQHVYPSVPTQRREGHQDSRPPHQDSESARAPSDKWLFQIRAVMGLQNL